MAVVNEVVDMRAAFSVRMGLPLPATVAGHHQPIYQQHHPHPLLMPSGPPFFPTPPPPPPLDSGVGEYGSSGSGGSPESPGYIQKQMQLLEQAGHHAQHALMGGLYPIPGAPITDAQVNWLSIPSIAVWVIRSSIHQGSLWNV